MLALAGAGGAWFVLSGGGGTVIEDFEDGIGTGWRGDTAGFRTTTDAVRGRQAGMLAFNGGSEVWRRFTPTPATELSFWWKTGAVSDNEFTVWFHDLPAETTPSMRTAQFGFEVGAENGPRVTTAPPFRNEPDYAVLTERPQANTWYKTRFSNVDYGRNTFDVQLLDRQETLIGEVQGYSFAGTPDSINAVYVRNHMNFSGSAAFLDHLRMKS